MANPTAQVASRELPYGADDKFYLPYPTGVADTFQNNEMIGLVPSTGFGAHFDDTQVLSFWGLFSEPQRSITTDLPSPILLMCKRPRLFTMPLAASNLPRGAQIGAPVYATTSGTVTLNPLTLSFANVVGFFVDIAAATPETVTGATNIWIDPMPLIPRGSGMLGVLTGTDTAQVFGLEALNRTILAPISTARTYTLPPVASTVAGDSITFITTVGASVLTLKGNAAETINGANTFAMTAAQYAVAEVTSDGTKWYTSKKI